MQGLCPKNGQNQSKIEGKDSVSWEIELQIQKQIIFVQSRWCKTIRPLPAFETMFPPYSTFIQFLVENATKSSYQQNKVQDHNKSLGPLNHIKSLLVITIILRSCRNYTWTPWSSNKICQEPVEHVKFPLWFHPPFQCRTSGWPPCEVTIIWQVTTTSQRDSQRTWWVDSQDAKTEGQNGWCGCFLEDDEGSDKRNMIKWSIIHIYKLYIHILGYTFPITTMSCTRMAKKKMMAKNGSPKLST